MTRRHIEFGIAGEDAAARHLERLGMRVLERGWRCALGELDLVAKDGDTLVFVEVKSRAGDACGSPEEAVGALKRRRVTRAALAYLGRFRGPLPPARFDVVAVSSSGVRHIPDAFPAEGWCP